MKYVCRFAGRTTLMLLISGLLAASATPVTASSSKAKKKTKAAAARSTTSAKGTRVAEKVAKDVRRGPANKQQTRSTASVAALAQALPPDSVGRDIQLLFSNPTIDGHLRNGRPVLTRLSGNFSGGQLRMEGQVNLAEPAGPHFARIRLADVQLAPVLALVGSEVAGSADARISGSINLRWSGTNIETLRRTLDGQISLTVTSASLTSEAGLAHIARFCGMEHLPRLDFSRGTLEMLLQGGRAEILSQTLEGPSTQISSHGHVNFSSSEVDLALNIKVEEQLALSSARFAMAAMLLNTVQVETEGESSRFLDVPPLQLTGKLQNPELELLKDEETPYLPVEKEPSAPVIEETENGQFASI